MNTVKKFRKTRDNLEEQTGQEHPCGLEEGDWALEEALKNFRLSVHAWSDAEYSRPRQLLATAPRRKLWRLAAGWTLASALVTGGISAAIYEQLHRQGTAHIAVAHTSAPQKLTVEQTQVERVQVAVTRAHEAVIRVPKEEDLLAKVDSDVAREVPSAMEPLAQLMTEDETK